MSQQIISEDLLDAFDKTDGFRRNPVLSYLEDGTPAWYLAKINRLRVKESTHRRGKWFIADFVIEETNNPKFIKGSDACLIVDLLGQYPRLAMRDIKNLIVAATGLDFNEVKRDEFLEAIGEKNSCSGMAVRITVNKSEKGYPQPSFGHVD